MLEFYPRAQNVHATSTDVAMNPFGTIFGKFIRKGSFFDKKTKKTVFQHLATSGHHNCAMIIDRRKFITK